jgi:hypothetical protein
MATAPVLVYTTDTIPGPRYERAEYHNPTLIAIYVSDILCKSNEDVLELAYFRMREKAYEVGANAVVGYGVSINSLREATAYGTAVTVIFPDQ